MSSRGEWVGVCAFTSRAGVGRCSSLMEKLLYPLSSPPSPSDYNKLRYNYSFLKSEFERSQSQHAAVLEEQAARHKAEVCDWWVCLCVNGGCVCV